MCALFISLFFKIIIFFKFYSERFNNATFAKIKTANFGKF